MSLLVLVPIPDFPLDPLLDAPSSGLVSPANAEATSIFFGGGWDDNKEEGDDNEEEEAEDMEAPLGTVMDPRPNPNQWICNRLCGSGF